MSEAGERFEAEAGDAEEYVATVRRYWRNAHTAYLENVGTTFQAGRMKVESAKGEATGSNLYLAAAAGILPGHQVLDAGCGVCGPSIDVVQNIERVTIAAITISPEQAATAQELVRRAGLESRIRVLIGDFHRLPFGAAVFDVACFFESSGYSYDPVLLFSEVGRVLRPGGRVYIKDVFRRDGALSAEEQADLSEFDRTFTTRTAAIEEVTSALAASGFIGVERRDLSDRISERHTWEAMFRFHQGRLEPTAFGRMHFRVYRNLPILYGEVKATRAIR